VYHLVIRVIRCPSAFPPFVVWYVPALYHSCCCIHLICTRAHAHTHTHTHTHINHTNDFYCCNCSTGGCCFMTDIPCHPPHPHPPPHHPPSTTPFTPFYTPRHPIFSPPHLPLHPLSVSDTYRHTCNKTKHKTPPSLSMPHSHALRLGYRELSFIRLSPPPDLRVGFGYRELSLTR
jgi:hypothetical protein